LKYVILSISTAQRSAPFQAKGTKPLATDYTDSRGLPLENANNPQKILEEITPKRNKKIGEQSSFYDVENDKEEF